MKTPSSLIVTVTLFPFNVGTIIPSDKSVLRAVPAATWYNKISVSAPDGSSSNDSTVPSGNAANAASVGANNVNGPSPARVSAKSAAITAASRVSCTGLFTTISVIVIVGGRSTASITCTTPLSATISATVT